MATKRQPRKKTRPAVTPEDRENQLVSLAYDLAEKQFKDGSASSQVTTHFLKMGSQREKLEQERLHQENLLLSAKIDQLASAKRVEELYETALKAMRTYAGQGLELLGDDDDQDIFGPN